MHHNSVSESGMGNTVEAITARTPYADGYIRKMDHLVNLILFKLSDLCPQMTGTATEMDGGYLLS